MSALRRYGIKTCPKCGGFVEAEGGYDGQEDVCKSYCGWDQRDDYSIRPLPATAIDDRDVAPLVEAAWRALPNIANPERRKELQAALKPFSTQPVVEPQETKPCEECGGIEYHEDGCEAEMPDFSEPQGAGRSTIQQSKGEG
jgi:hypothetical protein